MKMKDMTIADIEKAAEENAEAYDTMFRKSAAAAFREGACWAYEYLTQKGNSSAWCEQSVEEKDPIITDALLRGNGYQKMAGDDFYMKVEEVNGINVIFEYNMTNGAFFFSDALIPYPVALLSQMRAIYKALGVKTELRA